MSVVSNEPAAREESSAELFEANCETFSAFVDVTVHRVHHAKAALTASAM